jgi:putative membrane protein
MLGSLNKIWPWKEIVSVFTDRYGDLHPLVEKNILPSVTDPSYGFIPAVLFAVMGIAIIMFIEFLSYKQKK